jgi:hypothetical protein
VAIPGRQGSVDTALSYLDGFDLSDGDAADSTDAAAPDAASGSETPAGQQPGPIPYDRFQEVVRARQTAEDQLGRFQAYEGWLDPVSQLAELGVTPEQLAGYLEQARSGQAPGSPAGQQAPQFQQTPQQPQQPQDPSERYHAWLQGRGIDPFGLSQEQYDLRGEQFQMQELREQFQTERHQAQEQAQLAQVQGELSRVQTQFPMFQQPVFQQALVALWSAPGNERQSLAQVAQSLHGQIETLRREEVARYAAGKQQDAQVPVVAGGSAPPPVPQAPAIYGKGVSDEKRRQMIASYLEASDSP